MNLIFLRSWSSLPIFALGLASIIWGVNTPMIKLGLESVPVSVFMSIKFLLASLILLPFAIRTWKPLQRKDFYLIILSAVLANSIGSFALNLGLTHTTSINAAVIMLLGPLLLFVLSVEVLKEQISLKTFLGLLIALLGSLIIIGKPWSVGTSLVGNLLIVVDVLFTVAGTIVLKPILVKTSTFQVTFMSLFFGVLPISLYALTQIDTWDVAETSTRSVVGLVYGIVGIVVANFLFFFALSRRKAQGVGVYQYFESVAAIVAAWFLLSERPGLYFTIGAALVFAGIFMVEARLPKRLLAYKDR